MSASSARTGRRTRRRRGAVATRMAGIMLALACVVVVLLLLVRLVSPGDAQTAAKEQAAATAVPTAIPTASPVPTPVLPNVDLASWELRLIDFDHPLGEDFVPESLTDVGDGQQMDSRVAPMFQRLAADARAAGFGVYVCSGYRDYATQHIIYFDNHVDVYMAQGMTEEEANAKARLAVNYPGTSEHQSGLCVDVLEYAGQDMEPYIGGSGLMLWLEQHCAEYGFVIRYPNGKTDITGVEYEPWHLRYVGDEAARYIMEHGLCLEEFLDLYQAATPAASPVPTPVPTPIPGAVG